MRRKAPSFSALVKENREAIWKNASIVKKIEERIDTKHMRRLHK
ncbi:FbpB family small basic protein [Salimicrobium halophilum]|uniref:Fur-regulated basic protein B n=1 Tax=Salimicrobium halophilum TaxID=86666 RepID=A0A1G8Q5N6_9BACI|nr:FbpB family small basic protein [Salimicrobium halophilum]SDI99928.1 Fur-regulated basic protein B [Salimicrobium halophilum]